MKFEKWHSGIIVLIILLAIGGVWYFRSGKNNNNQISGNKTEETKQSGTASSTPYFSEKAKVMFFYSEFCGWCQKEKGVLEELGKEGYKVKPMDVGADSGLAEKYQIEGTPTFIAANGEKLVGFHEKAELKKWLDEHK